MARLRVAIASDIHARETFGKGTYAILGSKPSEFSDPLTDLAQLISKDRIKADYLLAPGDIGDQADATGLTHGWRKLNELASLLGAELLGAPGNHDIVTRKRVADPRINLKLLLPSFPTGDKSLDDEFWLKGWAVVEKPDHRFLIMDSTFGFPSFPNTDDETSQEFHQYIQAIERGTFPEAMETGIRDAIVALPAKLNVAVLHHHPQEHQYRAHLKDGYGPMVRGDSLVSLLSGYPAAGRWLVIHGHKHVPQLVNASTVTMNGPMMLCSASVGAELWAPVSTIARNQFHIATIDNELPAGGGVLCGVIDSYTWGFGVGWSDSHRDAAGLPAKTGFGATEDFRVTARTIADHMSREELSFLSYADAVALAPSMPYQMPLDMHFLERELEAAGLSFLRDRHEKIQQIVNEAPPS